MKEALHQAWDALSLAEKAEMMKVAVQNGITDLSAIREKYNEFAEGGHTIHIKPENRGKFTALKERTGHSATWFKEHGTPAQKKMATFELNARHWKHGDGGYLFGEGGEKKSWYQQHQGQWYGFLKKKGLDDADALRLSGFFTAQDDLESAGGRSSAARLKNNYGGMQKGGKNISYDSVNAYMEDKWRMMNSRFKPALSAKSIDEYATILGNPDTAGKGYLYYVTDKVKYNPKSAAWRAAQTQHMHNYINGMRSRAGMGTRNFASTGFEPTADVTQERSVFERPMYMLSNPDVFFNTIRGQEPVVEEAAQPQVEDIGYSEADLRRAEQQEGLRRYGMIMNLLNSTGSSGESNPLLGIFKAFSSQPGEFRHGGPLIEAAAHYYDGESEPTQQMNTGGLWSTVTGLRSKFQSTEPTYNGGTPFEVTVTGRRVKKDKPYKWVSARTPQLNIHDMAKGIETATLGFAPNPTAAVSDVIKGDWGSALHHAFRDATFLGGVASRAGALGLGATGLTGEDGIQKTANLFDQGEYGRGALSLAGDALNAAMAIYGGKGLYNYGYDKVRPLGNPAVPEGYTAADPKVRSFEKAVSPGSPALNWAEATDPTRISAEKGRQMIIDWYNSPYYRERWKNAAPFENTDAIVEDMVTIARNAPINYVSKAQMPSNTTLGTTSPRPFIEYTASDGHKVKNFDTGLDINVLSDLGPNAYKTNLHELLHYTTSNSHGVPNIGRPVYKGLFDPVELDYRPLLNESNIIRGKRYQHFIMDQNDGLLPKRDFVYNLAMENPQELERLTVQTGKTPEYAKQFVETLKNEAQSTWDIQENRAYLQEMFVKDILPHLKNPNDAKEIERFLIMHPEVIEATPNAGYIMNTLRPGDVKQYAKYFAEALSALPIINKVTNTLDNGNNN